MSAAAYRPQLPQRPIPRPATVSDGVELLREEFEALGQYPDDTVDALLTLLDRGAEPIAVYERERFARWFRLLARTESIGRAAVFLLAARHLDRNVARFTLPRGPRP